MFLGSLFDPAEPEVSAATHQPVLPSGEENKLRFCLHFVKEITTLALSVSSRSAFFFCRDVSFLKIRVARFWVTGRMDAASLGAVFTIHHLVRRHKPGAERSLVLESSSTVKRRDFTPSLSEMLSCLAPRCRKDLLLPKLLLREEYGSGWI